ncbi:hypothetical protein TNCT_137411 [Trichonephila clavata]|uniref:Uncharacterized protein n=1 Tax=Trichonephila clavata TaxID=2740835 RepID=A0A8X6JIU4_TRICU|nr:hypothetical protein TNCT_137411 [Trichonephila clavata]
MALNYPIENQNQWILCYSRCNTPTQVARLRHSFPPKKIGLRIEKRFWFRISQSLRRYRSRCGTTFWSWALRVVHAASFTPI